MSDLNKVFKADDDIQDPETNIRASLDLSGASVGNYYFNRENNYEYTKNWFNYKNFDVIGKETIISEIVQYGSPPLVIGELDTSKTFQLPSTTMTPEWLARIEIGTNTINNGWSGVDLAGNTYLLANYTNLNDAMVYNQDGSLAFTKLNNGVDSKSICLAKYNASGFCIWAIRIKTNAVGESTFAFSCVTDNQGTTYISGKGFSGSTVEFEDFSGNVTLSYLMPFTAGFIVAYNSSGVLDWITLVRDEVYQLWVDNEPIGNLYGVGAFSFYNGAPFAPTLVLDLPITAKYPIAKWRASSGLFQWATYLEGVQIFNWGEIGASTITNPNQGLTVDPQGNVIIIGSYVQITGIYNAATPTQPIATKSSLTPPPDSNLIVWTPRDENRNWSSVGISNSSQYMVATVENGFIYVSSDYGVNWTVRATIQNWSSVWCSDTGQFMVATVMDSVIYVSGDFGSSWSISLGEGSNARAWTSINGNGDGTQLVACTKNDQLYYSNDQGSTWTVSNSINAVWIDVAYNVIPNRFIALIQNGQAYTSTDGGATWSLLAASPVKNWVAISQGTEYIGFLAAVYNGELYSIDYTGTNWTVINPTPREWTDITADRLFGSYALSTEYNGSIYISKSTFESVWTPTTIPRNWDKVVLSEPYGLASVKGGQLYVCSSVKIVYHTFFIKYNSDGIAQWVNYINCPSSDEENNHGTCLTTQSNGNIIISGISLSPPGTIEFFAPYDFETPIKILNDEQYGGKYIACLSTEGLPLWVNKLNFPFFYYSTTLSTDLTDNIYLLAFIDNQPSPISLYQPTGQLVYSSNSELSVGKIILIKYYPNGFVQSLSGITGTQYMRSCSIRVLGFGNIYFSGWFSDTGDLTAYTSDYNAPSIVENFTTAGSFACRYSSFNTPWIIFPDPGYNLIFEPQFSIGGSNRTLVNNYPSDGSIELWGSKTGLPPSVVDKDDLNTSVISYLGHQPGYSIPIEQGVQTQSPSLYNHLTVGISEPTFPPMDPQPLTPGTIPYGFLPIFVVFPNYATGLEMNNSLNDSTNAILSAVGVIPSDGLFVSGLSAGDKIRIELNTPTYAQYLTLTVAGFILSEVIGTQTGIVFEESTRYVSTVLGTTSNASATLIILGNDRYAPMFWQPEVIDNGTLNLILQLYPKWTN